MTNPNGEFGVPQGAGALRRMPVSRLFAHLSQGEDHHPVGYGDEHAHAADDPAMQPHPHFETTEGRIVQAEGESSAPQMKQFNYRFPGHFHSGAPMIQFFRLDSGLGLGSDGPVRPISDEQAPGAESEEEAK